MTQTTTPDRIHGQGLLIGWRPANDEGRGAKAGFAPRGPEAKGATSLEPVLYDDEGHIATIAPTGAGKGVSCAIPALLRHDGPLVAMDSKGENYIVTRRARRELGQKVQRLDPFEVCDRIGRGSGDDTAPKDPFAPPMSDEAVGLNPLDLLPFLSDDRDAACRSLADMLLADYVTKDQFWRNAAVAIMAGLIDLYETRTGPGRSVCAILADLHDSPSPRSSIGELDLADLLRSRARVCDRTEVALTRTRASIDWLAAAFETAIEHERQSDDALEATLAADITALEASLDSLSVPPAGAERDAARLAFAHKREQILRLEAEDIFVEGARAWLDDAFQEDDVRFLFQALREESDDWERTSSEEEGFASCGRGELPLDDYPVAIQRLASSGRPLPRAAAGQALACADKTWASILVTLRTDIAHLAGRSLARSLGGRGLDLEAIRRGDPVSLYLVFPPDKLRSHAPLFRTLVSGLLSVITSRMDRPAKRTLFLLDEIAQLGHLDQLVTAKTLLRGYGVQGWTFWQDLSQIQANYPRDWESIVNNCKVLQAFGCATPMMARAIADLHDIAPERLRELPREDMLVSIDGATPLVLRRPISWQDPALARDCDPSPFAPRHDQVRGPEGATRPKSTGLRKVRRPTRSPEGQEGQGTLPGGAPRQR